MKNIYFGKVAQKILDIIINAFGSAHEKFGVWIKAKVDPKSRRDGREERLSRSKFKQAFLIDAELFMYLIQWKVRRLNRALLTEQKMINFSENETKKCYCKVRKNFDNNGPKPIVLS